MCSRLAAYITFPCILYYIESLRSGLEGLNSSFIPFIPKTSKNTMEPRHSNNNIRGCIKNRMGRNRTLSKRSETNCKSPLAPTLPMGIVRKVRAKSSQEILNALQLPKGAEVIIATGHEGLVWASQAVQIHTATYHRAVKPTASDRELQVLGAAAGAGIAWALHFPTTKSVPNMFVNCM